MAFIAYCHQHARACLTLRSIPDPISVHFDAHLYTTADEAEIALLDAHGQYNKTFRRVEGPEEYDAILRNKSQQIRFTRGPAQSVEYKGKPVPQTKNLTEEPGIVEELASEGVKVDAPPPPIVPKSKKAGGK